MEKDPPKTPTFNRLNRRGPGTPDRVPGASSHLPPRARGARATMAPGDFAAPRAAGSRATMAPGDFAVPRATGSRTTMAPGDSAPTGLAPRNRTSGQPGSSMGGSSHDITRRSEADNKTIEMELLYDKYLQTRMMALLIKKKKEEQDKAIICQLASLAKEKEATAEQLRAITLKEKMVQHMIILQNSLDTEIEETNQDYNDLKEKTVKSLQQLKSLLAPADMLKCKNIVIPTDPEGLKRVNDLFAECAKISTEINTIIGPKHDSMLAMHAGLQAFTKEHENVQKSAKIVHEALRDLQVLALKEAAFSLTQKKH